MTHASSRFKIPFLPSPHGSHTSSMDFSLPKVSNLFAAPYQHIKDSYSSAFHLSKFSPKTLLLHTEQPSSLSQIKTPTGGEGSSSRLSAGTTHVSTELPKIMYRKSPFFQAQINKRFEGHTRNLSVGEDEQEEGEPQESKRRPVHKSLQRLYSKNYMLSVKKNQNSGDSISSIKPSRLDHNTPNNESQKSFLKDMSAFAQKIDEVKNFREFFEDMKTNRYRISPKNLTEMDDPSRRRKTEEHKEEQTQQGVNLRKLVSKNSRKNLPPKSTRFKRPDLQIDVREAEEGELATSIEKLHKDIRTYSKEKSQEKVTAYHRHRDVMMHIDNSFSASPTPHHRKTKTLAPIKNGDSLRNLRLKNKGNTMVGSIGSSLQKGSIVESSGFGTKREGDQSSFSPSLIKLERVNKHKRVVSLIDRRSQNNNATQSSVISIEDMSKFGRDLNKAIEEAQRILPSINPSVNRGTSRSSMHHPHPIGTKLEVETAAMKRIQDYFGNDSPILGPKTVAGSGELDHNERKELIRDRSKEKTKVFELDESVEIKQRRFMKGPQLNQMNKIVHWLPNEAEHIKAQLKSVIKKVDEELCLTEPKVQQPEDMSFNGQPDILDEIEMRIIKEEYRKIFTDPQDINYDKLDKILSKLSFFSKLTKEIRMNLLKCSSYSYFPSKSVIYRRGDRGDQIYVILRGSVNVRSIKYTPSGEEENVLVSVLYDGAHFGEYTLTGNLEEGKHVPEYKIYTDMGTMDLQTGKEVVTKAKKPLNKTTSKKVIVGSLDYMNEDLTFDDPLSTQRKLPEEEKRSAIIEVAESCDLLCIRRNQFQAVFLNLVEKELDMKLKVLMEIPFLQTVDPFGLIPLANNMKSKVYSMGEVIIAEGAEVNKFQIVSQGRCKVVLKILREADLAAAEKFCQRQANGKKMNFSIAQYKSKGQKKLQTKFADHAVVKRGHVRSISENPKSFDQETVLMNDGKLHYVELIVYGTLAKGDFLGGRALLSLTDFTFDELKLGKERMFGPAKLSVITDSPFVEVFELDEEQAKLVPDYLIKILRRGLKNSREFDDYDIEKEKKLHEGWNNFKGKAVDEIIQSKTRIFEAEAKLH